MNRQTSENHYRKPASEKACGNGGFYVYPQNTVSFCKSHGESTPRLAAALNGIGKTKTGRNDGGTSRGPTNAKGYIRYG